MTRYEIRLNDWTPPSEFGQQSRPAPLPEMQAEPEIGIGDALMRGTLAYRTGQSIARKFIGDSKPDPEYNAFEAWKQAGADDANFNDYMETRNADDLFNLEMRLSTERERKETISQYGLTGEVADFVAGVAGDYTTYLGFGLAMMLKAGVGLAKAGAISGALAGTSYVALEEFASPEQMDVRRGAMTVAATTIFGGLLGGAAQAYAGLKTKGLLQKNFDQFAIDAMDSAAKLTDGSMGAQMVDVSKAYKTGIAGGPLARGLAKASAKFNLSPKIWFQTGKSIHTQDAGARFLGVSMRPENAEAVPVNWSEEVARIRETAYTSVIDAFDAKKIAQKFGKDITEDDMRQAAYAAYGGMSADELTPLQRYIHDWQQNYYKEFASELKRKGVPYFNERFEFGQPVKISQRKATERIDELRQTLFDDMKAIRNESAQRMEALELEIKALDKAVKNEPDPRYRQQNELRLSKKTEFLADLQMLARATDDDLLDDASITAQRMANGIFHEQGIMPLEAGSAASKSKFFKPRYIDPRKYIDFLDHNQAFLAVEYADSVSPYMAFTTALGGKYKNINEFAEDVKSKILSDESIPDMAKREKEASGAVARIMRAWNQETGIELRADIEKLGEFAPYFGTLNEGIYMSQMGGQTLASLLDPVTITIHHGLKEGGANYGNVMAKIISSPEFRNVSRREMGYMGIGLEVGKNKILGDKVGYEILDAELGNKMARGMRKGALWFGRANMSVYWDQFNRVALGVAQSGILKERLFKGLKNLSKDEVADLVYLGIDDKNIGRIVAQLKAHGKDVDGVFMSNTDKWTDIDARDIFVRAIKRDNRRTSQQSITGDVPFFFRTPLGKLMMKYRGHSILATHNILGQSLQRQGAGKTVALAGVASMVSFGTLIDAMLKASQGKEVSTDPDELLWGGIVRSGIAGVFPEAGGSFLMNKLAGTQSGQGRLYEYTDVPTVIAGPTGKFLADIGRVAGAGIPVRGEDGYGLLGFDENGNPKKRVLNSVQSILPIPIVKPWLSPVFNQFIEE